MSVDQAQGESQDQEPGADATEPEAGPRSARRIVAVGGGKGGSGKSLIAANLGIYLATLGKRVVLVDADLGGANLHAFVGIERPRVTLTDLFERRVARVEEVVVETGIAGLGLVSGEGSPSWLVNPPPSQKHRLMSQVQQLDVDFVVVDLGPGSGVNSVDFFNLADVGIVVVVPEPTSVENTYRFLKSAFLRRLRKKGFEAALALAQQRPRLDGNIASPRELLAAAHEVDPALEARLVAELATFRPRVVVNQARTRADEELPAAMATACRRRLGIPLQPLGHLELDDAVWLSIRRRRPLLVELPDSVAAKGFERLTRRLLALDLAEPPAVADRPGELTHYEVLDVEPTATEEELRRAHRRVRELYGEGSLVVAGLFGRDGLAEVHARIEAAYETLMDDATRRTYDQRLFPEGLPTPRPRRTNPGLFSEEQPETTRRLLPTLAQARTLPEEVHATPPPGPPTGPETLYSGALLRELREARGVELVAIAQRTKIGIGHLRALEDERHDLLPAAVYLRGFLTEYARCLRLDVARVVETYLDRHAKARPLTDEEPG